MIPAHLPSTTMRKALCAMCWVQFPTHGRPEALDIISKHARLAIRSGHDVGKTALLSWIAIWFA